MLQAVLASNSEVLISENKEVTCMKKFILVIIAVLYCVSPIDILPDAVPIVGFLDDVIVVLTAISNL